MKRIFLILIVTIVSTAIGLYFRPSYFLIGQLDWFNVLSKGQFIGFFSRIFTQNFLDESFYFVLKFMAAGFIGGLLMTLMVGKNSKKPVKKKK
jgi:hypothetical protein